MPYEHNLPSVLNPEGDIIVPLCIPHDADYTALLLGVLRTLEEVERYERDPNYDDESAQIVAANWRDRTITPLIEAIATGVNALMPKITPYLIDMGASNTITSAGYLPVLGSGFAHTFSHKKAKITVHNIDLVNSAAGNQTFVAPDIELIPADALGEFQNTGATSRQGSCVAVYSNLPVGIAQIIRLVGKRSAGTGTVNRQPYHLWIIEEWD